MKRALAWLAGIVGIAALGRLLAGRRQQPDDVTGPPVIPNGPDAPSAPAAEDPAEELRRKLAAQREPHEETEAPVDETLEERRARVHAKAREAIEAMDDDEGPAA